MINMRAVGSKSKSKKPVESESKRVKVSCYRCGRTPSSCPQQKQQHRRREQELLSKKKKILCEECVCAAIEKWQHDIPKDQREESSFTEDRECDAGLFCSAGTCGESPRNTVLVRGEDGTSLETRCEL